MPIMRLNFFAIFRFCVQILRDLGEKIDPKQHISSPATGVDLGFAWVDTLLESIVEHLRDDSKKMLMRYWRALNLTKTVFDKLDGKTSVSEFLWSI